MEREALIEDIVNEICKRFSKELCKTNISNPLMVMGALTNEEEKMLEHYTLLPFSKEMNGNKLLLCELTIPQMTHIALGYYDTPLEQTILEMLLQGKEVFLLERGLEYRKFKDTAPLKLYALYHEYESTLRQYGVRIIKNTSECVTWRKEEIQPLEETKQKTHVFQKKFLLEKDLIAARVGFYDTLELTSHCKITPLAEEFIRTHHLSVQKI